MFNCFYCNKICEEENATEVRCSLQGFKMYACSKCVSDILIKKNKNYIYHDGILWTTDSRQDKRLCQLCGCYFIPSDRVVKYYGKGDFRDLEINQYNRCGKCMKVASSRNVYCLDCKCFHRKGKHLYDGVQHKFKSSYGGNGDIHFVGYKDSKSWSTGGSEMIITDVNKIKSIEQLPFQEIRDLPSDAVKSLDSFYRRSGSNIHCTEHYNFRDNISITGEIKLKFGGFEQGLKDAMFGMGSIYSYDNNNSKLKGFKTSDLSGGIKQNKYRNMYFDSIDDDGYVVWKYIDIFGNIREKKESINVFYQAQGLDVNNNSAVINLKYVLSSNIQHKVEAFRRNDEGNFNSCQRSGNYDGLARGAYDTVTNGCICPILIYKNNNMERAVGRITTRIMYDKDGEMYILLERLYHDGSFSKQTEKGEVYKAIVEDIKSKGYNVIVSNYSAHDNSTLNYIQSLGLKHRGVIKDLYQPLRQLFKASTRERCGYYADGGTECLGVDINGLRRTTDYLDKAYLL